MKDKSRHTLDHRFEFICSSGKGVRPGHIYQSEGMGKVWGQDHFKLNACNFCDDICAEVADVSFGDAVSEPYSYGNMGANFVIVRSSLVNDLLSVGVKEKEIVLDRVPLKAILERQRGTILLKRADLQHRLHLLSSHGDNSFIPAKRFPPQRRLNIFHNENMELREKIRLISRNTFANYRLQSDQADIVRLMEKAIKSAHEEYENDNYLFCFLLRTLRIIVAIQKRLLISRCR